MISLRARVYRSILRARTILIHNEESDAALETLLHEILELRFRRVERVYREAFNALVGAIQSMAYSEKEQFLNDLPNIIRAFEEGYALSKDNSLHLTSPH